VHYNSFSSSYSVHWPCLHSCLTEFVNRLHVHVHGGLLQMLPRSSSSSSSQYTLRWLSLVSAASWRSNETMNENEQRLMQFNSALLSCSHIVISILTFLHEIFELIKMMMMMMMNQDERMLRLNAPLMLYNYTIVISNSCRCHHTICFHFVTSLLCSWLLYVVLSLFFPFT